MAFFVKRSRGAFGGRSRSKNLHPPSAAPRLLSCLLITDAITTRMTYEVNRDSLVIVVVGASGHLARVKIFPSLYNLRCQGLLPPLASTLVCGYARTRMSNHDFKEKLKTSLNKNNDEDQVDQFVQHCVYVCGETYSDVSAYQRLAAIIQHHEQEQSGCAQYNRVFYLAVPPNVFAETGNVSLSYNIIWIFCVTCAHSLRL